MSVIDWIREDNISELDKVTLIYTDGYIEIESVDALMDDRVYEYYMTAPSVRVIKGMYMMLY